MARKFWRATAEAVVGAVDAVHVSGDVRSADQVAEFAQLTADQARAALDLAVDLGFLVAEPAGYRSASPLARALSTPNERQRATALRVLLEVYVPFTRFRERLIATGSATLAAQQTKLLLDLDAHAEEVKETLVSLGQFSQAIRAEGGGAYVPRDEPSPNALEELAAACGDNAAAEARVLSQVGDRAAEVVSRPHVIVPLADAFRRAREGDGRGAVVSAGNAVESFLAEYGTAKGVALAAKHGINAKAEELKNQGHLAKKLLNVSKYLGHVRNAADHGADAEVGAPWSIRRNTGVEYVFVACSFISAVIDRGDGKPPSL